jgi:hypothetical protein
VSHFSIFKYNVAKVCCATETPKSVVLSFVNSHQTLSTEQSTSTTTGTMTPSIIVSSSPKSVADIQYPKMAQLEDLDLTLEATSDKVTGDDEKKYETDLILRSTVWLSCPASQKSLRTQNPIRAIVDPIVKKIQSGTDRGDGKDHISLAVRRNSLVRWCQNGNRWNASTDTHTHTFVG